MLETNIDRRQPTEREKTTNFQTLLNQPPSCKVDETIDDKQRSLTRHRWQYVDAGLPFHTTRSRVGLHRTGYGWEIGFRRHDERIVL